MTPETRHRGRRAGAVVGWDLGLDRDAGRPGSDAERRGQRSAIGGMDTS